MIPLRLGSSQEERFRQCLRNLIQAAAAADATVDHAAVLFAALIQTDVLGAAPVVRYAVAVADTALQRLTMPTYAGQ